LLAARNRFFDKRFMRFWTAANSPLGDKLMHRIRRLFGLRAEFTHVHDPRSIRSADRRAGFGELISK
jgi:hypothetical protein